MNKDKAYRERMEAQLKVLEARIDELKAMAQKAKAEVKIEYMEGVEALESNRKSVKKKLDDMKKAGKEAGKDLKEGIEASLFDLKQAVETAFKRFKKD
jgi:hypothetical protein